MPVVRPCMRSRPWCCLALAVALVAIAPELAVAQSIELANMPPDRTMPGFAVIDSSTMSIEHIAPLHSTTLTLFSTLRSDDLVPRDLGLEILPWLTTHPEPGSTVKDVYDKQYRSGVLGSIGQYAAWSLAVSQHGAPSASDASFSLLALGFRTFVWSGRANSRLDALMTDYDSRRKELDTAIDAQTKPGAGNTEQQRVAELLALTRAVRQDLVRTDKSRVGFLLETGTVFALHVPANMLRNSSVGRRAWWATPIYRFERKPMTISAIVRYIDEHETRSHMVDLGGRITAVAGGIEYFLESLGRSRSRPPGKPDYDLHTGRAVGGVSYGFSRSTRLTFSMGKSYRNDFSQNGSLVASFGVNISLGEMALGIPEQ